VSGETTVGSIVGFLRLNITDFEAGIAKAQAMADHLDRKDVDVRVKVDTAGAETKLAAVAAATDRADNSGRRLDATHKNMGRSARFLVGVLLTVGPALIPLAAATIGLAAGFGTMGAAGVLAIVGIRQEMKAGTTMGQAYTTQITTLKGNLTTLSRTAAAGVLQPFQQSVADLQKRMPVLNGIIGDFSAMTGRTAGLLTTGLVSAFVALEPLSRDAGMYIYTLSQRFAELMSGPGVVSFGDYVRSVFPHVMQQVESIVGAVIRLVAAFAPFGTGVLTLLGAFADAISAVPVDVLSVIATGGLAIFLGFKTFALLSMPIHEVGVALRFMGVSAETAAVGMRSLTIAAAAIGVLIALATIAYTAHSESVRKDQQAVNDLTDALIRGHGVIEADTVAERANALAKDGTLAAAKMLGFNLGDVTAASLGNAEATARVTAHTKDLNAEWATTLAAAGRSPGALKAVTDGLDGQYKAVDKVTGATKNGVSTLNLATQAYNAYNAATKVAAAGGDAQAIAVQALAAKIGTTAAALALATDGQKKTADAAAAAAAKMYLENDAAGILKGGLDLLNGEALSAADAQNAFDSSLVNMGDHVTKTGAKVTFTTTSIKNMSSASVELRGQLNGQVANLQRVAEANGGLANSTGKARDQMVTMRKKIIDNAVAHGIDRAAVTAYIDSILKIPKTVPPTKLDVATAAANAKIAAIKKLLATIPSSRTISMYVAGGASVAAALNNLNSINKLAGMKHATGGRISGPGTGTSDSIPALLSDGEYVVNAAQTAKNRPLLDAINNGAQGFASGGSVGHKRVWTVNGKEYASAIAAHNAQVAAAAARAHAAAVTAAKHAAAQKAAILALATTQRQYQYTYLPNFIKALSGTTEALAGAGRTLVAEAAKTTSVHQMSASMLGALGRENASLGSLATSRDAITTQLADANSALTAAQKEFTDQQTSVTSSLSSVDLTKANSPAKLIAQLTGQIKSAADFGSQIGTLKGEGLNGSILKQLADVGPGGKGSLLAQMMGATPDQIAQINTLMVQLQATASTTGTGIATSLYGAGVQSAQGLVDGLTSKQGTIEAAMKRLADAMVAQIKKSLKIKSPSTVMRGLGQFTGQGFALGLTDSQAGTVRAASALALSAVPKIAIAKAPTLHGSLDSATPAQRSAAVGGAAFHVEKMTVVGYDPDEAVRKFGHEVKWAMVGT